MMGNGRHCWLAFHAFSAGWAMSALIPGQKHVWPAVILLAISSVNLWQWFRKGEAA